MFYTIDRIYTEKKIVVLIGNDEKKIDISFDVLSADVDMVDIKEGLILRYTGNRYEPDYEQTEKVKNDTEKRFKALIKNNLENERR